MWYTSLLTALLISPVEACLALSLYICVKATIEGPWEHQHCLAWQLLQRKSLLIWHTVGNADLTSSVKCRKGSISGCRVGVCLLMVERLLPQIKQTLRIWGFKVLCSMESLYISPYQVAGSHSFPIAALI